MSAYEIAFNLLFVIVSFAKLKKSKLLNEKLQINCSTRKMHLDIEVECNNVYLFAIPLYSHLKLVYNARMHLETYTRLFLFYGRI